MITSRLILLIGLIFHHTALSAFSADDTFKIVANGEAQTSIVIATAPSSAAYLAAMEVQHGIKKVTGATLPIVKASDVTTQASMILIGESKFTKELKIDCSTFSHVEYMVSIDSNRVILIGKDNPITTGI